MKNTKSKKGKIILFGVLILILTGTVLIASAFDLIKGSDVDKTIKEVNVPPGAINVKITGTEEGIELKTYKDGVTNTENFPIGNYIFKTEYAAVMIDEKLKFNITEVGKDKNLEGGIATSWSSGFFGITQVEIEIGDPYMEILKNDNKFKEITAGKKWDIIEITRGSESSLNSGSGLNSYIHISFVVDNKTLYRAIIDERVNKVKSIDEIGDVGEMNAFEMLAAMEGQRYQTNSEELREKITLLLENDNEFKKFIDGKEWGGEFNVVDVVGADFARINTVIDSKEYGITIDLIDGKITAIENITIAKEEGKKGEGEVTTAEKEQKIPAGTRNIQITGTNEGIELKTYSKEGLISTKKLPIGDYIFKTEHGTIETYEDLKFKIINVSEEMCDIVCIDRYSDATTCIGDNMLGCGKDNQYLTFLENKDIKKIEIEIGEPIVHIWNDILINNERFKEITQGKEYKFIGAGGGYNGNPYRTEFIVNETEYAVVIDSVSNKVESIKSVGEVRDVGSGVMPPEIFEKMVEENKQMDEKIFRILEKDEDFKKFVEGKEWKFDGITGTGTMFTGKAEQIPMTVTKDMTIGDKYYFIYVDLISEKLVAIKDVTEADKKYRMENRKYMEYEKATQDKLFRVVFKDKEGAKDQEENDKRDMNKAVQIVLADNRIKNIIDGKMYMGAGSSAGPGFKFLAVEIGTTEEKFKGQIEPYRELFNWDTNYTQYLSGIKYDEAQKTPVQIKKIFANKNVTLSDNASITRLKSNIGRIWEIEDSIWMYKIFEFDGSEPYVAREFNFGKFNREYVVYVDFYEERILAVTDVKNKKLLE